MVASAHERQPVDVLVVDPEPATLETIEAVFSESPCRPRILSAGTPAEGIEVLRTRLRSRPAMAVVDLEADPEAGVKLVELVKSAPDLKHIPIVALTREGDVESIARVYAVRVNSCISKGQGAEAMRARIRSLASFWLDVAKLPPGQA